MPLESELAAHYQRFCTTHPFKETKLADATWRYIDCGRGGRTFFMIHGLAGDATGFYQYIESLENEYRVIAPTVPALDTMDGICRGLDALLAREQVGRVILCGASWGGMVAQGFLHRYAEHVEAVILIDTAGPDPAMARRNARQQRALGFVPWWLGRSLFRSGIKKLLKVPGELTERPDPGSVTRGLSRRTIATPSSQCSPASLLPDSRRPIRRLGHRLSLCCRSSPSSRRTRCC
jgi:pimeloyl-ACP methyl ester carboxylesterase